MMSSVLIFVLSLSSASIVSLSTCSYCTYLCQNVINLSIELGESNGVSAFMWNISTQQSQASMQENIFTSKPHMSTIFHIGRQLGWKNIQMDE
jgi:hypothetical protein